MSTAPREVTSNRSALCGTIAQLDTSAAPANPDSRKTFTPKAPKLVAAAATMTKDFKASTSTFLAMKGRRAFVAPVGGAGAAPAQYQPLNDQVQDAVHVMFTDEAKSNETDCTMLLTRFAYHEQQLQRFEAGLTAVLAPGQSALQYQLRMEDVSALGRNGVYRQYRDQLGAAGAGDLNQTDRPTLCGPYESLWAGEQTDYPYNLYGTGSGPGAVDFILYPRDRLSHVLNRLGRWSSAGCRPCWPVVRGCA